MLEQQAAQQRQLEMKQREQQEKQQLQQLLAKKDKPSKSCFKTDALPYTSPHFPPEPFLGDI